MLDAGGDEAALERRGEAGLRLGALQGRAAQGATEREVVALGAAGGEDDLVRPGAQARGDRLARFLKRAARLLAGQVEARGIGEDLRVKRRHRLDDLGAHGRGGGMVEIDRPHRTAPEASAVPMLNGFKASGVIGATMIWRPASSLGWSSPGTGPRDRTRTATAFSRRALL